MLVVLVTCFFIVTGVFCQNALAADRVPQPPQYYIYISEVSPNPVLEVGLFYVEIRDQNDDPIQGATVTIIGYDEALTNSNGKAWFIAPSVSEDTVYTITAYKYNYAFWGGPKTITVRNKYLLLQSVPSQMDEQRKDWIKVVDQDGNGEWLATVNFGGNIYVTDIFGWVYAEAPDVTGDQYVTITATKAGYDGDSDQVFVRDLDVIPATIDCYVFDASTQEPIEDAMVWIEKLTYGGSIGDYPYLYTDEYGHCCFTVYPDTEGEGTIYEFTATAIGYESDTEQEHAYPDGTYTVVLELPQEGSSD
jgi:hypothetical protein